MSFFVNCIAFNCKNKAAVDLGNDVAFYLQAH